MKQKKQLPITSETTTRIYQPTTTRDAPVMACQCVPLVSHLNHPTTPNIHTSIHNEQILVSADLFIHVKARLEMLLHRHTSISMLIFHVAQIDYQQHTTTIVSKQRLIHASPTTLEQLLASVRRVLRADDMLFLHTAAGAALFFSGVDQPAMARIAERIYSSLDLLQGKTLHPPLRRETIIQLGWGSYPQPANNIEALFSQVSHPTHHIALQPALHYQYPAHKTMPTQLAFPVTDDTLLPSQPTVPFFHLPATLAPRLTRLLPYTLARQLRCVPVGYARQTLTIAMAEPTHKQNLQYLRKATGYAIFPVACDEHQLNLLLTQKW